MAYAWQEACIYHSQTSSAHNTDSVCVGAADPPPTPDPLGKAEGGGNPPALSHFSLFQSLLVYIILERERGRERAEVRERERKKKEKGKHERTTKIRQPRQDS